VFSKGTLRRRNRLWPGWLDRDRTTGKPSLTRFVPARIAYGGEETSKVRVADQTDSTDLASCPDRIGDPPSHISIARKNIWAELIAQLPEGHLQSADRFLLEVVTGLMAKQRNRRSLITKGEVSLLVNALCKLGLTPVDRARVIIPVKPKASVYDQFDEL
jgi:hypothetical protein